MTALLVYTTIDSMEIATKISEELISKKYAACVNIIPGVTSIYSWEGKVNKDTEITILMKTSQEKYPLLEAFVKHSHPYDCPAIFAIEMDKISESYSAWLHNSLAN